MREVIKLRKKQAEELRRKRVAAYTRVSSGKDAMLHSLSAQVSYYNALIQKRGDWEFAGIYADEALTGTKSERPEFQRLLTDCRTGKIDMVITKSITRFARNTVTLLETARELKLLGIDIFFEKENIHTLSADGELMLTLLASYAQEESRSVSENCKWRIRKMFQEGRPNTGKMLGYRLFDGKLHIVPEEAEIVKQIFADYLSGMGLEAIMKKLNTLGTTTLHGKKWGRSSLHSILQNEKYAGDMLLQKTYRLDHISKKRIVNQGEKIMYHVKNSHEAIIEKTIFSQVQSEIKRRADKHHPTPQQNGPFLFTGMILCCQCSENYRRKITGAGTQYAKPVWICPTFNIHGKDTCNSQQIPENILIAKTAEILGMDDFDRDMLQQKIAGIHVVKHNRLVYIFHDGGTVTVHWDNPSRRESWTEEMKQVARERQLKIIEERKGQHGTDK